MRNEHTHAHVCSQFVSVNVANHPHVLVLPRREQPKDKQQLLSHHLSLYIHHTLSSITFSPSLCQPVPSFTLLPGLLSPLSYAVPVLLDPLHLPQVSGIDSYKASLVISQYLLIHLHSISLTPCKVVFSILLPLLCFCLQQSQASSCTLCISI